MIRKIAIKNHHISYGSPVFIIAEAGVNHNGDLKTALKLIDEAASAGVDAVKFQTFVAGDVVTSTGKMAEYQIKNMGKTCSQLELLKKIELPENFYKPIIERCEEKKVIFLSTPHGGFNSVDLLVRLGVPAFKFGSGDLTNFPLLKYAAKFGKPMILGTGMATMREVGEAVGCIEKTGNNQIITLHCTTNYPCPYNEVNLKAMRAMMRRFDILVGYSDHTNGCQVPIMAATMGACVIEKHFTLDKKMVGPDHQASSDPAELKLMVQSIREIPVIQGVEIKKPNYSEQSMIKSVRKSIVATKNIKKNELFTEQNLGIKRPGTGLHPRHWDRLIGKKAKKDFMIGDFIGLL